MWTGRKVIDSQEERLAGFQRMLYSENIHYGEIKVNNLFDEI
jgi:hypothetical protein